MALGLSAHLKLYLIAWVVFFAVDLIWLGVVAKPFYDRHLGHLLRPSVYWPAAIAFYAFFLLGLLVFVIAPAVAGGSVARAALLGIFFGFITYQTYELTNWALIKDWPAIVVWVDIAWGMALSGIVATATTYLARLIAARGWL